MNRTRWECDAGRSSGFDASAVAGILLFLLFRGSSDSAARNTLRLRSRFCDRFGFVRHGLLLVCPVELVIVSPLFGPPGFLFSQQLLLARASSWAVMKAF